MVLLQHWSCDPFLLAAITVAVVHERGLRRLNRRQPGATARRRRRRSLWFYLGLAVALVAVESPVDYWSDRFFWVHMIQHLLLMFAAPVPIAAGAPWQPLQHGLPDPVRHGVLRSVLAGRWSPATRRLLSWLRSPWLAVAGFNAVIVCWHLPGPFDLAERNQAVHVWLMHGSFFAFGLLFWLQLIESRPLRPRLSPPGQMASIFATATVMWVLAMALSLFSGGCWYAWYVRQEPAYLAFSDQQLGAGIMWVSGTVWALPAMIAAIRRLMDQRGEGGAEALVDTVLKGRHGRQPGRQHARLAGHR